jgi:pimeloyl-ACP methyl ester carboxylesterase
MILIHRFRASAFLFVLTCCSSIAATTDAAIIDDPAYTHPQRLVEVEPGRRLNLYCIGKGSPTVVFESGLTDETDVWAFVQPAIAAHTQACSYDRAGSGYSDPGQRAGTSANSVDDLHRLLVAAAIKPSYILVGHSYGGMNVRLYADLHREEVAGMVLLDPSEEDWVQSAWRLDPQQRTYAQYHAQLEPFWQGLRECAAAAKTGFVEGTELYKRCVPDPDPHFSDAINAAYLKVHLSPAYQQATLTENLNIHEASSDQLRSARRWYGAMPLIVLASSPRTKLRPDETQEHMDAVNRVHLHLFDQMALQSSIGVVRVIPDSEHNIQMTQPQAVIDAILEVLRAAIAPQRPENDVGQVDSCLGPASIAENG